MRNHRIQFYFVVYHSSIVKNFDACEEFHTYMLYYSFVCRSVETVDDGSVTTSVTVAEVADTQEQQPPQSKANVGIGRRINNHSAALSNGNSISNVGRATPRSHMEQEKRIRREIANSNERRRMQSINAGFQSLRTLLPHHEGEKLSKVSLSCGFILTSDRSRVNFEHVFLLNRGMLINFLQ